MTKNNIVIGDKEQIVNEFNDYLYIYFGQCWSQSAWGIDKKSRMERETGSVKKQSMFIR